MSNDYALFILIVPNDFDLRDSVAHIPAAANVIKQECPTVSM